MSVPEQVPYKEYRATGSSNTFEITFYLPDPKDLVVMVNKEIPLVGAYSIVGDSVVFSTPPSEGDLVEITRDTQMDRETNFKSYDNSFRPETINFDLDKIWLVLQESNLVDAKILARLKQEIEWRRTHDFNYDELAQVREKQLFDALKGYTDTLLASTNPGVFQGVIAGVVFARDGKSIQAHIEEILNNLELNRSYIDEQVSLMAPQATTYNKVEVDTKINAEATRAQVAEQVLQDQVNAVGVGNKAYLTYAEMDADKANNPINSKLEVTNDPDPAKNGTYQWNGTTLTKSTYDPLTQAQNYTDDVVKNNTVSSGSIDGTELAIFTDKNGRRTWLEIAADGGMTERTKSLVRGLVFTPVPTTNFSYAITDKNGRVLSAIYKDGSIYPKHSTAPIIPVDYDKRFKILGIGNSFTLDAFMYVPFLLKEMGVTNFEIVALHYGGCTLEQHWGFASNDSKVYSLYTYKSENEAWEALGKRSLKEGLNYTKFDTITLQQQSARSCDYTTYQPFLNNLIDYIYTNINYPTRLGWHSIPASPDNGWSTTYPTSTQFYNAQVQAVKNVLRDTPIEYAIPNNTAIQNARGTVLGELGARSNMTHDGLHLQEGLPALVAAYALTLKWLEVFNLPKSIFGSRIAPTDDWLATKAIQDPHGPSVGVTTSNILIAQKCAIAAIKNEFETSTIN